MPSDLNFKVMNAVHRAILKLSGGKAGWSALSMPVIELTTTGRKTGNKHTVMLTSPVQEGDAYCVVASRGGDDKAPAWFLNLEANPEVEVSVGGKPKQPWRAHVATADERADLWPRITADHKNYAGYQTKTKREIPVVVLTPVT